MITGFRVSKNSLSQNVTFNSKYQKITWGHLHTGQDFDLAQGFYKPKSGPIYISAFVWISAGMTPKNGVIKLMKNATWDINGTQLTGDGIGTGIGVQGTFPGSFVLSIPGVYDEAIEGDTYSVGLYADYGTVIIDGNPAHTWFSGVSYNNLLE